MLSHHYQSFQRAVKEFVRWTSFNFRLRKGTGGWERGRPRPQSVRSTLKSSDWMTPKKIGSRFALNAGEGARAPSNEFCEFNLQLFVISSLAFLYGL